jgi:hypothetical protein
MPGRLLTLALVLTMCVGPTRAEPLSRCEFDWAWQLGRTRLGFPFSFYDLSRALDYSPPGETTPIESLSRLISDDMKAGASRPIRVLIIGPPQALDLALHRVTSNLAGLNLAQLHVLIIGSTDIAKDWGRTFDSLGAVLEVMGRENAHCVTPH